MTLFLVFLIGLLCPDAWARTGTFCAVINTAYVDAGPTIPGTLWDDYLNNNSVAVPLRGVRITVTDTAAGSTPVTLFASDTTGCASFTVTDFHTYQIETRTWGVVGNNHEIHVRPSNTSTGHYIHAWPNFTVTPAWLGTQTFTQNGGTPWDEYTAVAWALYHRDGGLSGTPSAHRQWEVWNQYCSPGSTLQAGSLDLG